MLQELTTVKQHLHLQSELMDIQMLGFVILFYLKEVFNVHQDCIHCIDRVQ